jgi:plastocyanin
MQKQLLPLSLLLGTLCYAPLAPAVTNTVQVGNYFFNPTNLTINVGDTVRWTNTVAATATHDVTRTNSPFSWASPDLTSANRTYLLTFSNAGSYPYYCQRHVYAPLQANRHTEQTGTVSVVSINLSPSVAVTNPVNNARLTAPANILLQASATDDGSVTNVQFFSGGALLGNDPSAPYVFTLNNAAAGNYSFTARAQDNTGLAGTSAVVNVFVLTNALVLSPTMLPNGQFQLTILGIAGQTYATEASTNLANWSALITNVAPANTFNVTDTTSTNVLQRFYRARQDL